MAIDEREEMKRRGALLLAIRAFSEAEAKRHALERAEDKLSQTVHRVDPLDMGEYMTETEKIIRISEMKCRLCGKEIRRHQEAEYAHGNYS